MEGVCVLTNTSNKKIKGYILFNEEKSITKITINVKGLKKNSKLGFHIHEYGDLRDGCTSVCQHFNPNNTVHGGKDSKIRHAGDLGNIEIDENGEGVFNVIVSGLYLIDGPYNVAGRSIIIHEKEDDFGQPTGNAGSRVAAGSILLVDKS